jgi:hypothetical protein
MRFRLAAVSAVACSLVTLLCAGQAMAAAEVHRLNLVLSGIPTQVMGGDYNDALDSYNSRVLDPKGYETLKHLQFTWAYDGELRYFVRPNFAIAMGVTQLRASETAQFLPAITQVVGVKAEILTVPIHIGGLYYLQAYNQGDFQARAYIGGGLMQYTYSHARFSQSLTTPDASWNSPDSVRFGTHGSTYSTDLTQDAPGYYMEAGAHMFFAARFSVAIGAVYSSGKLSNMRVHRVTSAGQTVADENAGEVVVNSQGKLYQLDVGGLGLKMALGIGF